MASTIPLFPLFSFLGFTLQLVPLYWQVERWNVGTLWYIFWVSLSCFTQYFNSVVWAGNVNNSAPAWCEISIRIAMGVSVGIPAASMCINRRLYEIARLPPTDEVSKAQHRRIIIFESLVCGLFPAAYIALQLVVQRHRFNILEDVGCVTDYYDALPTYFIAYSAPTLLNFGSLVFGVLALHALTACRANVAEVLAPYKGLTQSRFLRLAALALTTLFLSAPSALLNIAANATAAEVATKVSGDASPFDFGVIARIPRSVWASSETNLFDVELGRWIAPACAFLFFAFHGFAEEAREHYKRTFMFVSNAFWNTLARMGYVRPLPPLARSASASRDTPSLRLVISRPMRGVSGTGSLFDPTSPRPHSTSDHSQSDSGDIELKTYDPFAHTYYDPFNQPVTSPTTTLGGLSFVQLKRSSKDPTKWVMPTYHGWHTFSNAHLGLEPKPVVHPDRPSKRVIEPEPRVVEPARKAEGLWKALPDLPRLRRLV